MKHYLLSILLFSVLVSCGDKQITDIVDTNVDTVLETIAIPDTIVDMSALIFHKNNSTWTLDDQMYSGYGESYYSDSTLKQKIGFFNGRKQNASIQWYPDGHYQFVSHFHKGKLQGEKKQWSADTSHILVAHLNYEQGKVHGKQKQWYKTGELYKILNMNMGREEGMQQAYRKNGDLYANYEAKNGRMFGLKKSMLCYGLEDENIQYEN